MKIRLSKSQLKKIISEQGMEESLTYMSYKDLLGVLIKMSHEELQQTITLYDEVTDEYYPVTGIGMEEEDDVLDRGHLFLKFSA
jgi:sorbitol-specific phosphotransferase system component IIA